MTMFVCVCLFMFLELFLSSSCWLTAFAANYEIKCIFSNLTVRQNSVNIMFTEYVPQLWIISIRTNFSSIYCTLVMLTQSVS